MGFDSTGRQLLVLYKSNAANHLRHSVEVESLFFCCNYVSIRGGISDFQLQVFEVLAEF